MSTYLTGTVATNAAGLVPTFVAAIDLMAGKEELVVGERYRFSMASAGRTVGPFPPSDLTSIDQFVFSIAAFDGTGIQMLTWSGEDGDTVGTAMGAGTVGSTYHFYSDGDEDTAPTYVYIALVDAGGAVEEFIGAGLAVRAPIDLTTSARVLFIDDTENIIYLDHGLVMPSAWSDEFTKRGSVNLTLVGSGSASTGEPITIVGVDAAASPPTLTYSGVLANPVTDNYALGSRLGKLVANQFVVSYTDGVIMLFGADALHNSGLAASAVEQALPGTPVLGDIYNSVTGYLDGSGLLIDHGAYANYGLPGLYTINTPVSGDIVAVSPDGTYKRDCVLVGELFPGLEVLMGTSSWEII